MMNVSRIARRGARSAWRVFPSYACAAAAPGRPPEAFGVESPILLRSLDTAAAKARLDEWQREKLLGVASVWDDASPTVKVERAYLPFRAFDLEVDTRFTGSLGYRPGGQGEVQWRPAEAWHERTGSRHAASEPEMQVYSGFRYSREIGGAARGGGGLFERATALGGAGDAGGGGQGWLAALQEGVPEVRGWEVHECTMEEAMARELAIRSVHSREAAHARKVLQEKYKADSVAGVRVEVNVRNVRSSVAYLPVYVIHYTHGNKFNTSDEIVPEAFVAAVGAADGTVVANRHFSERKAQVTVGGLATATALAEVGVAPLLGTSFLTVESLLGVCVLSMMAGVAARRAHTVAQEREDAQRQQSEEDAFAAWGAGTAAGGPARWADDEVQRQRDDQEWTRWETTDRVNWREDHRRSWAESILRGQMARRADRQMWENEREAQMHQARDHAEREHRRFQRFGAAERMDAHGRTAGRTATDAFGRAQGRRDFMGFYKLLGVDISASSREIKAAFRKAALEHHPDVADTVESKEVFAKVQTAYNVLRDEEKRRQYDSGMLKL